MSPRYKLCLLFVCSVVSYIFGIIALVSVPGVIIQLCESRSLAVSVVILICSYFVIIATILGVLLYFVDESRNI